MTDDEDALCQREQALIRGHRRDAVRASLEVMVLLALAGLFMIGAAGVALWALGRHA